MNLFFLLNMNYRFLETELSKFFSLIFRWLQNDIYIYIYFKDPLKRDMALEFCRNKKRDFSILTGQHINHTQIRHIRNNWWGPLFFFPGDSHTKDLLHPGLEGVL